MKIEKSFLLSAFCFLLAIPADAAQKKETNTAPHAPRSGTKTPGANLETRISREIFQMRKEIERLGKSHKELDESRRRFQEEQERISRRLEEMEKKLEEAQKGTARGREDLKALEELLLTVRRDVSYLRQEMAEKSPETQKSKKPFPWLPASAVLLSVVAIFVSVFR